MDYVRISWSAGAKVTNGAEGTPRARLGGANRTKNENSPRDRSVASTTKDATIMYMTTLPLADARAQLSKLVDEAVTTHERFEITRNGHRAAVLLSADDYDTLRDTIAVLSDAELLTAHHEGQAAIAAGHHLDANQLTAAMRTAGRLPG